jgi:hypothetical protein
MTEHPEVPDKIAPAIHWFLAFVLLAVFALGASDSFRDGKTVSGIIYCAAVLITFFVAVKWRQIGAIAKEKGALVLWCLVGFGVLAGVFSVGALVGRRQFATPAAIGDIVWNFEQTAHGAGFFLNMSRLNNEEWRVAGFQAHGKNNSSKPIEHFSGYLRSELTNEQVPILLMGQDSAEAIQNVCRVPGWIPTSPQETFGIPPFADFDIATFNKPVALIGTDGITLTKFMNDFVPFTIVLEYNDTKYERLFSREEVQNQVSTLERTLNPQSNPHVLRRPNAKPAPLPDLVTLVPPDPARAPPGLASPIPPSGLPKFPFNSQ